MPSEQYSSSATFPSPQGLHPIASLFALQTETQVVAQHAKRRGGPKKVWLCFSVVDARGRLLSQHTLVWKCITQKNFSNQLNITQYVRNPFGSVLLTGLGTGAAAAAAAGAAAAGGASSSLLIVLHGALTQGRVSNTVGVNVAGRAVDQHPRFLLSSGKGAEGARSSMLFYHSDPGARVQLQSLTIEHRELKISFEQAGTALLEFAPKFKPTYVHAAKEQQAEGDAASATVPVAAPAPAVRAPRVTPAAAAAEMSDELPAAAAFVPLAPSTSKSGRQRTVPARFNSDATSAPAPAPRRSSLKKLSAMPPAAMPAAVAERLAKRKRSLPSLDVAAAAAAAAEPATATLDSPMAPAESSAPMDLPPDSPPQPQESSASTASEPSAKRQQPLFGEPDAAFSHAAAAAHFSGFESDLDFSSQDTEDMLIDVGDGEVQLQLDETDGGDSPDSADATPRLASLTPPPFMHQLGAAANSFDADHADADAADLTMMASTLDEAEGRCSPNASDELDPFGLGSGLPSYLRPKKRRFAAGAAADESAGAALPPELAAASSKDGLVTFSAFGAGPQQQLSPGLHGYHSPLGQALSGLDFGGLGLGHGHGLPRSPFSFLAASPHDHPMGASPMPPLSLAPCPSSPLPSFANAIALGDQLLPNLPW